MITTFIFDLDGVITDTAHYHFLAWQKTAQQLGVSFTEVDNEALKGVSRRGSLDWILKKGGITLAEDNIEALMAEKNADYREMIGDMQSSDIFPGVTGTLAVLRERGYNIGLASASKNAEFILTRLGIRDAFDYVADAAAIPQGKPAPDIFLDVAQHFSASPASCIGIEDAVSGVQAIKSAEMFAVGIGSADVLTQADIIYPDMLAFDIDEVLVRAGDLPAQQANNSKA
ncbi:MAG: beta-phosphoglucomutase [Rickettsiales bacterium]|nr:beta-phosphoglucomutase [Rickettsiales bacterium]|tara:strand:- start:1087 stop:1773 length:687 start_codon:yes stop_codon:yes gene_type:complete